jgi:hypothetical protein
MPFGTGIRYRRYVIFGKLADVAQKAATLNQHAFFSTLEYTAQSDELLPLYDAILDSQPVLSSQSSGGASSVCRASSIPIKNSYPLMLLKNKTTGIYSLSTDPYALCGKIPFTNPFPPDHTKYQTYQNRRIYQPYDGQTEWVRLLGFILPVDASKISSGEMILLSDVCPTGSFNAGEKLNADELMVWRS